MVPPNMLMVAPRLGHHRLGPLGFGVWLFVFQPAPGILEIQPSSLDSRAWLHFSWFLQLTNLQRATVHGFQPGPPFSEYVYVFIYIIYITHIYLYITTRKAHTEINNRGTSIWQGSSQRHHMLKPCLEPLHRCLAETPLGKATDQHCGFAGSPDLQYHAIP